MTENDTTAQSIGMTKTYDRRTILRGAAAAALGGVGGGALFSPALAQSASVTAVMASVVLPSKARAIVENGSGVKIQDTTYISPVDTLAKLLAPGGTSRYDLMVSVTDFVRRPIMGPSAGSEKVMAFDLSRLPNLAGMSPLFKKDIQERGGKTFTIPVFWGHDSPLYRTDKISPDDEATKSWGILFDDKYAGRVALRDDGHVNMMIAALSMGNKDPVTMQKADLAEVRKFLVSKKKNFRTFWSSFGEATNLLASGEVWAMYGWMPMRGALLKQGVQTVYSWPKEGTLVWSQSAFIPKDSPNADAVHKVVNAMLSTDYGVALTEASNYGPVAEHALTAFSAAQQRDFSLDIADHPSYPYAFPDNLNEWIEAWNVFRAA